MEELDNLDQKAKARKHFMYRRAKEMGKTRKEFDENRKLQVKIAEEFERYWEAKQKKEEKP
jgi:hypothetical protein